MAGNIEAQGERLNLNSVTREELTKVSGISDTLASKIIEYRDRHGRFESLDELDEVEGFAETRKEEIKGAVTL